MAPLASVLLFLAAIVAAFSYLRLEEIAREQEAVQRDVEYVQQRLRLRLLERQEQLMRVGRELATRELDADDFVARAESLLSSYPELQSLAWIDDRRRIRARVGPEGSERPAHPILWLGVEAGTNFQLVRELQQAIYVQGVTSNSTPAPLQLLIPLSERGHFSGLLLAEYSIDGLFRYGVPSEVTARFAVALVDAHGQVLAGSSVSTLTNARRMLPWSEPTVTHEVAVSPVGNGLLVRGQMYRTGHGVVGSGLFSLVIVLSAMTAWMLIGNWRHTRRRMHAQRELEVETAFRRAMENSMLTGMRALDLQGRITYVNAAFCEMTGWHESELVGTSAPFPYWPEEDYVTLQLRLQDELAGRVAPSGIPLRVKRRNGARFEARLYVSPLIDARGEQTGWMTSMVDVSEQTRIRDQLSASHARFTTVMEAVDASISVAPLGSDELLFANKLYRQWFGGNADGHLQLVADAGVPRHPPSDEAADQVDALAGLPTDALADTDMNSAELYIETLGKWLEVRTSYLSWVDGRLAQLVIATDISTRRLAEEEAAAQAERAHNASRLITMGEMASSVAHELNQPLTAIQNYCSGMISRLRGGQLAVAELDTALHKTSHQAQRAGQIIQRIRSFVQRSEPNRALTSVEIMVNEAIELVEIEMRRHNVRLIHQLAAGLPALHVDPILIEQVLINLLRNAAEAIDAAQRTAVDRLVNLQVRSVALLGAPGVEFSVSDRGSGLTPDVMSRLYEAFFSTKSNGMGIGLSLCRSIVESHLGRIQAQNLYNDSVVVGCRFTVWLPVPPATTALPAIAGGVTNA